MWGTRWSPISTARRGAITPAEYGISHGASDYIVDVHNDALQLVAQYKMRDTSKAKQYNLSNTSELLLVENGQNHILKIIAAGEDILLQEQSEDKTDVFVDMFVQDETTDPACTLDMTSYHLLTGVTRTRRLGPGTALFGEPLDAGWGDYYTKDDKWYYTKGMGGRGDLRDGNAETLGGGVLFGYYFENGFGIDGTLRAGRVKTDPTSNMGVGAKYDSSTWYIGSHIGLSQTFAISPKSAFRVYGQYIWSRQDSENVVSDAGESICFKGVNSSRFRAGLRYIYQASDSVSLFADAGWEYQVDGRVRSTLDGIPTPGLRTNGHMGNSTAA